MGFNFFLILYVTHIYIYIYIYVKTHMNESLYVWFAFTYIMRINKRNHVIKIVFVDLNFQTLKCNQRSICDMWREEYDIDDKIL
jgi:hypothetical protein